MINVTAATILHMTRNTLLFNEADHTTIKFVSIKNMIAYIQSPIRPTPHLSTFPPVPIRNTG